MPDKAKKKIVRRGIIGRARVNIDAAASHIFKRFKGNDKALIKYLTGKIEFNITEDIACRPKATDEYFDIIFSDPSLLGNFIASLNAMGCNLQII